MKKVLILSAGLLLAALSVTLFAAKTQDAEKSLLMHNVEAIARGESSGKFYKLSTTYPKQPAGNCPICGAQLYTQRSKVDCLKGGSVSCTPQDYTLTLPHGGGTH